MEPTLLAGALAFLMGYAVGVLPVAWLLVRQRHKLDMRYDGLGGTGSLDAFAVGGIRTAMLALVLEALKGALVGLGARLFSPTGWFIAAAIAGCVAGDAFSIGFRRGGRGLAPLVSGLAVALPAAGLVTALVAIPVAVFTSMRGRLYEVTVAIAVPVGLIAGTRDWRTLAPAAFIVAVLWTRAELRRRRREARLLSDSTPRVVLDHDRGFAKTEPARAQGSQNPRPWDS
jgi:glycerol-3-phosphate acyltransferase PlsY